MLTRSDPDNIGSIILNSREIRYFVVRSARRKTVSIRVEPPEKVVVTAPRALSAGQIEALVFRRRRWIDKRLTFFALSGELSLPKQFQPDEPYVFMGKVHRLSILEAGSRTRAAEFCDGILTARIPSFWGVEEATREQALMVGSQDLIRRSIIKGYERQAREYLTERIHYWVERTGLHPSDIKLRNYRSRWGTCSSVNALSISWKVMTAAPDVIDYLIVHELCHIKHKDHGNRYWALVNRYVPDHKELRKQLSECAYLLEIG